MSLLNLWRPTFYKFGVGAKEFSHASRAYHPTQARAAASVLCFRTSHPPSTLNILSITFKISISRNKRKIDPRRSWFLASPNYSWLFKCIHIIIPISVTIVMPRHGFLNYIKFVLWGAMGNQQAYCHIACTYIHAYIWTDIISRLKNIFELVITCTLLVSPRRNVNVTLQ